MTKEGTVLDGKYEIWKEVGRGGMSIVYLARDNRLNKQWAVKEIKNDGSKSTTTLLKGLEREANILKNVDHPVLPRIVDIINQEGVIYVVMDFIEGTTIQDRLKKEGAQPQDLVIEWGLQLASALDYLHNMNPPVIYRDMKPSNVMIKPEGGVKLIDFGTAKEYIVENNADTTALGTRGYAAPEQFGDAQGRGIYKTDARTDIYNLGATLYHIVTGKNPCEPPYEMKPIREWNPALSSGLEKIILKCTQPNPNDRYQNCSELMYALEHYTELDDAYKKKNKKKMAAFIATTVLTVAAGVTSLIGYSGMQKIKLDNYNTYIEIGNDYRAQGDYVSAAEEYKKAFELDGRDAEAYEKYIQVYIDASNEIREDGTTDLQLETGLNVVANRIKAGHDSVNKNDQVLYKLAITYFDELNDYKLANKYFNMIDKEDPDYGELAKYYGSVSLMLSSTNFDAGELMEEINSFAVYNQNEFTNQNDNKFINYKTIGRIYATYITEDGAAEMADQVMNQACEDLEEYTGTTLDVNDYFYAYYENLIVINEHLAKTAESDSLKEQYNSNVINYSDEYMTIWKIKLEESGGITIGGGSDNIFNTTYYNVMSGKADAYANLGEYDQVLATYKEIEDALGKKNKLSNKVYADHLDYIYSYCVEINQDPANWKRLCSDEVEDLLAVYEEGQDVSDINTNRTWNKRKDTVDKLYKGLYDKKEDNKEATEADENQDEEAGEMGE
ncbi:MAG: serine/threonine protein kinase [Lachnospiraceae bacterium]|nr:serine/threonine protein kinase [Lachnospiraceae bacterium]MBQ9936551.1 protein kinase [Lachnospiraceae bacterium]